MAAILGFLIFNFPFGRIFLGDAGAYSVGFLIAWLGIALATRHAEVTPLAMMLVMFWPLADLALTICCRRRKVPVSHPDRLHFHQVVMPGPSPDRQPGGDGHHADLHRRPGGCRCPAARPPPRRPRGAGGFLRCSLPPTGWVCAW